MENNLNKTDLLNNEDNIQPQMNYIYLSVVVPVYNEEECLEKLFYRLITVCENIQKPYEIIFTNDGSKDSSSAILKKLFDKRPDIIRVIEFNQNFGQHQAILAAFKHSRGQVVVNLDADMQNPPEEIPKLLKKFEEGYDYVGSVRDERKDNYLLRHIPSRLVNFIRKKVIGVNISDHGCMFRAYSQEIVKKIIKCDDSTTFITILGATFAKNPIEIPVKHQARLEGKSKYSFYKLFKVSLDLFTAFSTFPLHFITLTGIFLSISSTFLIAYFIFRHYVMNIHEQTLFYYLTAVIFLMSVLITSIGIVGEYIGRIYQTVRNRPLFVIKDTLGF